MKKGFTLVETMVAIALLAIALVGPYVAVQNALQGSYVARDQLVASQLAQEGVEYVRSIRDNNYHNGRNWLFGFADAQRDACYGANPGNNYCTVDPTQGDFNTTAEAMQEYTNGTSTVPKLKVSGNGLYNHQNNGGSETRFQRLVQVQTVSPTEVRIIVHVVWVTSGKTYVFTVMDGLTNWI